MQHPSELFHYTSKGQLPFILATCAIDASPYGVFGAGVYFTDLGPSRPRLEISTACWNRWRPERMTGVIRVMYLRDPGRIVAPHIWLVDSSEFSLAGQDISVGWWTGVDPDDPEDIGEWSIEQDKGCNPPVHFGEDLTNST